MLSIRLSGWLAVDSVEMSFFQSIPVNENRYKILITTRTNNTHNRANPLRMKMNVINASFFTDERYCFNINHTFEVYLTFYSISTGATLAKNPLNHLIQPNGHSWGIFHSAILHCLLTCRLFLSQVLAEIKSFFTSNWFGNVFGHVSFYGPIDSSNSSFLCDNGKRLIYTHWAISIQNSSEPMSDF